MLYSSSLNVGITTTLSFPTRVIFAVISLTSVLRVISFEPFTTDKVNLSSKVILIPFSVLTREVIKN